MSIREILIALICICVLFVLLKVFRRSLKYIGEFLGILVLVCLCVSGCGDEGVLYSDLVINREVLGEGVVTEIPPEIWEILKYVREHGLRSNQRIGRDVMGVEAFDAEVKRVEQIKTLQEAFYTKYINAGGIAVVANADVTDKQLIEARRVVLTMTSKHPVLRERLLSRHGRSYLILHSLYSGLPEYLGAVSRNSWGGCNAGVYWKLESVWGFCNAYVNPSPYELRSFTHEFAHALKPEIGLLQPDLTDRSWLEEGVFMPLDEALKLNPGFGDRLEHAYNIAYARGTWKGEYANVNYEEYWAEGAAMWFYDIGPGRAFETYEAFFERDPLLAALLDEWFPRVSFWADH